MDAVIYVNKCETCIPDMDYEVKVKDLAYKNGKIFIQGRPYRIQTLTEIPCTPVGMGFDEYGLPQIITCDNGEEYTWMWNDIMLFAIITKNREKITA